MEVSFNSYYLYKKYEKRANQPWLPVYPETLSIDGNGSMPKVLKTSGDPVCYVEPQERWVDTGDYACEEITPVYRWLQTEDTICIEKFDGKYKLKLRNSSIISAECSSTSSVTSGEVATQYSGTVVSAEIGDCCNAIGNGAFAYCTRLTGVTIGNGCTTIGDSAFMICSGLTSITIPDNITNIGSAAFAASSLANVTIGSGITSINEEAFYGCYDLNSITVKATIPPTLGAYAFDDTNNCPIYVPIGSVEAYKAASGWSSYGSRIQAIL